MQCDKESWLSPGEARSLRDPVKKVDRKSRRLAVGHGTAVGDGDGDGGRGWGLAGQRVNSRPTWTRLGVLVMG